MNIITGTLTYSLDVSFLSEWYMNYAFSIFTFLIGVIVGGGLMWYYWRHYKNTDDFKNEINERLDQLKEIIKSKL